MSKAVIRFLDPKGFNIREKVLEDVLAETLEREARWGGEKGFSKMEIYPLASVMDLPGIGVEEEESKADAKVRLVPRGVKLTAYTSASSDMLTYLCMSDSPYVRSMAMNEMERRREEE